MSASQISIAMNRQLIYDILDKTKAEILDKTGISVKLQATVIQELYNDSRTTPFDIINIVAEQMYISSNSIMGQNRTRIVVDSRFIVILLIKEVYPDYTLKDIGRILKRDHTTILYAMKTAKDLLEFNTEFKAKYNKCINKLKEIKEYVYQN